MRRVRDDQLLAVDWRVPIASRHVMAGSPVIATIGSKYNPLSPIEPCVWARVLKQVSPKELVLLQHLVSDLDLHALLCSQRLAGLGSRRGIEAKSADDVTGKRWVAPPHGLIQAWLVASLGGNDIIVVTKRTV